jgi:FkbM family methyltransferase
MNNEVRERINTSSVIEARRSRAEAHGRAMIERAKGNPFYGYIDIAIPGHGEVTLFSNNDDYVAMEYFWSGSYETMSLSLWAQLCASKPPVIMDIGSYTGLFGLIAAKVSPQSRVLCIEPIDRIYSRIMINKKVNEAGKIEIVKGVASDRAGIAHLSISVGNDILPTGTSVRTPESQSTIETFDVQAHAVDDLLCRYPDRRCGIMKIDAERHEVSVLNGARKSIERWRPDILIEILDRDIYAGVFDFLGSLGGDYRSFQIDDAALDVQLDDGRQFEKGHGRNFLLSARPIEAVENDICKARENCTSIPA